MVFSIWTRLCQRIGLVTRSDWIWAASATESISSNWVGLPKRGCCLHPGEEQRLWLQTRCRVKRGWYLFGIRHRGENRRATGWLQVGTSPWRQGRPMYPVRRRWRVVRLRRPAMVTLELQRLVQPLQLEELLLLRLPEWDAWRRIRRRLRPHMNGHLPRRPDRLWRQYNQLLAAQARRHSLVPYERWQLLVEIPALNALPTLLPNEQSLFHLHNWGSAFKPVAPGHWVIALQSDTALSSWGLQAIIQALHQTPKAQLLYGDEDRIDAGGCRHRPQFKPAWNRELCWCDPSYSSCWVVSAQLWNQLLEQPERSLARSSWQGMVLGLLAQLHGMEERISHIALFLSHSNDSGLTEALPAAELESLLQLQLGPQAPRVSKSTHKRGYRLHWPLPASALLSVVIPTRDRGELLAACLASIERHPAQCDVEIVIADNGSSDAETLLFLERFQADSSNARRQIVVATPGPFNYSEINNRAVDHCQGSVLLLLNNDVEFLSEGWGHELASHALRAGIGCVGAQLLYPDHTVQHGGVILGIGGMAGHAHQDLVAHAPGYQGRLQLAQEMSAVTAACLAISREHWQQLGGLDARHLAVNYNDVDLCLRARQLGLRNLYLPQVRAIHHESKSRGRPEGAAYRQWRREWAVMERRWGEELRRDPAYSPHLSLESADWSLALRSGAPLVR